jgi:hypothetical protein
MFVTTRVYHLICPKGTHARQSARHGYRNTEDVLHRDRTAAAFCEVLQVIAVFKNARSGALLAAQNGRSAMRTGNWHMISASATEIQNDFDTFVRKAAAEPVEVKHESGSGKSYLISEQFFRDLLASYRRAKPVAELSDDDVALIRRAKVVTESPYNLDDMPDNGGRDACAARPGARSVQGWKMDRSIRVTPPRAQDYGGATLY